MSFDGDAKSPVIDADAHVVESARTWDFMDPSEKQYRPVPLEAPENVGVRLQFWLLKRPELSDQAKRKILYDNAKEFYRL